MIKARTVHEQEIIDKVYRHGQEHLLRFWEQLNEQQKDLLVSDLEKIDFVLIREALPLIKEKKAAARYVSPPEVIHVPESGAERERRKEAERKGASLISGSKAAALTAAGGQSTRLGIDAPKGTYPVTPVKKKSLFQVLAEKILAAQRKYSVKIPWIIMVSKTNRDQTIDFFKSNGFFGLDPGYVRFIEQGMNPAIDQEGKIFLAEKHRVFLSPNGHGGVFGALKNSGSFHWLNQMGAQELFYFQVDNVLVRVLDPVYVGYHALGDCQMSSKGVKKKDPSEKMGVFVREDGRTALVEYSELFSVHLEQGGDAAKTLMAGNIAIHMISLDFAQEVAAGELKLPFHLAYKKVPHVDEHGNTIKPQRPCGYKIESFIFDALKLASRTMIMEVERQKEFSPLKNRSGDDSPETVYRDQVLLYARWLEDAGIDVPRDHEGMPKYSLEVSPLFAACEEEFVDKVDKNLAVNKDTYIE
ncbi:MAG: UTP--glucose-1-phosphate uridylyltransferase [Spirochaetota bacterium]